MAGKRIRMSDCILIGIDSSTSNTGYSVYRNAILEKYGVICTTDISDKDIKFETMCKKIIELLDTYSPAILVAELTTPTRNAVTQRQLTLILGVIYGWCVSHDCECVFYRVSQWRHLVAEGNDIPRKREELKQWAIDLIKNKYNTILQDDVAEAILIGQARINECDRLLGKEQNGNN